MAAINTDFLYFNSENNMSRTSEKLKKEINQIVGSIDFSHLPDSFCLDEIPHKAREAGVKYHESESGRHERKSCTKRRCFNEKKGETCTGMSIHVWDIKNGEVEINYKLIVNQGSSEIVILPTFFRYGNKGFLEKINVITDIPGLPKLSSPVVQRSALSKIGVEMPDHFVKCFLLSEAQEFLSDMKKDLDQLVTS